MEITSCVEHVSLNAQLNPSDILICYSGVESVYFPHRKERFALKQRELQRQYLLCIKSILIP